jgi:quercetin dioxygenase-like cupin family protein
VRAEGEGWRGVEARPYRAPSEGPGLFRDVARCELLGGRGLGGEALGFELRVFALAAGGASSLERHRHAHAVMVLAGRGEVILDRRVETLGPGDVVYVAPWSWHQFHASLGEPLRFLCVVDRERDRPETASPAVVAALALDPALGRLLGRPAPSTAGHEATTPPTAPSVDHRNGS